MVGSGLALGTEPRIAQVTAEIASNRSSHEMGASSFRASLCFFGVFFLGGGAEQAAHPTLSSKNRAPRAWHRSRGSAATVSWTSASPPPRPLALWSASPCRSPGAGPRICGATARWDVGFRHRKPPPDCQTTTSHHTPPQKRVGLTCCLIVRAELEVGWT